MRVWNPATEKFSDTAKRTDRLPTRPAAVYPVLAPPYQTGVARLRCQGRGAAAVDADMATALSWLTECGGVIVTDRSTSGGGHLICPLAIGTSASHNEMVQLVPSTPTSKCPGAAVDSPTTGAARNRSSRYVGWRAHGRRRFRHHRLGIGIMADAVTHHARPGSEMRVWPMS